MQTIVIASDNANKLKEIRAIFQGFSVLSQREAGFSGEVEETGATFAENAALKARAVSDALHCIALADDSGLCVDALNGAPGVYSARYAGGHGNDKANRALLLQNLAGQKDRTAHFQCAVVLAYPGGGMLTAEGSTSGHILEEETGEGGFGYDCLFFSDDLQKSFGLASEEEKNAVSHRFRALEALRRQL